MKRFLGIIALLIPLLLFISFEVEAASTTVYKLDISGVINPVTVRYVNLAFEKARESNSLILVVMDTPGGLVSSMRTIVQEFLNSPVPVVVYVYPRGARAASAGTFILLSAHIAAMAPGTTVGAAHPVTIGGGSGGEKEEKVIEGKIVNDLVALIKAVAKERGRNEKWAEMAIRTSATLTADEALKEGVIDIVSPSIEALLKEINGRNVKLSSTKGVTKINLENYNLVELEMPWYYKVLHFIGDPNIAYLLLFIGFYALIFEVTHPGAVIPGVIGVLCLILFFFSFQILPFSIAGLALVFLGIILLILELFITSHGVLTVGGALSLLLGSFMLVKPGEETPYIKISTSLIVGIVAATVAFFAFALSLALYAQKRKPVSGREGMVGEKGVAKTRLSPEGTVLVHGELWRAISLSGDIEEGDRVEVLEVNGLTLKVKKIEERREK
ncbi:MAG: nodulation protein NfeD [Synergistetes bacterium]|nr:nodulation protein NfeD [Synergistota bacterium]MCX8127270.1 nodulation protein NfeD [Synergistota bacterium]MDW8191844.1 nodulation protein NfeD [Synergistota bacterium]